MAHVRLVGVIDFVEFEQRRAEYIKLGIPKYELVEMAGFGSPEPFSQ